MKKNLNTYKIHNYDNHIINMVRAGFIYGFGGDFEEACSNGHLEVAKKLIEHIHNPHDDFVVRIHIGRAFPGACSNGHLEVAKWLYDMKPDIDISAKDDYAFRQACLNNHLEVVKWLLRVKPNINVDEVFRSACHKGELNTAQYLKSLFPRKYSLKISESGNILYHIHVQNTIYLEKEDIEMCSICNDNLSDTMTNCKHLFCKSCITTWLQKASTCPYCRDNIYYDNLYNVKILTENEKIFLKYVLLSKPKKLGDIFCN